MNTVAGRCSRRSAALAVRGALRSRSAADSVCHSGGSALLKQLPSPQLPHRPVLGRGVLPGLSWSRAGLAAFGRLRHAPLARQMSAHADSDEVKPDSNKAKPESEYWGIEPRRIQRQDGSAWPWNCFRPADTYTADMKVDVRRHYPEQRAWLDRVAHGTVQALRVPVDLFFKDRHVSHALMLETVAAVPGMVGGMLLHLRSLRRFEQSGGWIRALLEEAENERMHLMTWVEVLRPAWWERALVLAVQGAFFNAYFVLYLASPRLAHRFVGYLEEEAVRSYSDFLHALDVGHMPNGPAPLIAVDYWRLPSDATIRDVVLVIRADEAHHRDVNHFAADVYHENKELRKSPAPVGYH